MTDIITLLMQIGDKGDIVTSMDAGVEAFQEEADPAELEKPEPS